MGNLCMVCNRDHGPFALRRGAKAVCLTCVTINDPVELLRKMESETDREIEQMARDLGIVTEGP